MAVKGHRNIAHDRGLLKAACLWLGVAVVAAVLFAFSGCQQPAHKIVAGQTPGVATGAGATITGPANSASPTSQLAERIMSFAPLPVPQPTVPVIQIDQPQPPTFQPPLAPTMVHERVQTTIGQHQDAAGIVKIANAASGWSKIKWLGLVAIVVGIGGLLHAAGNNEGYPLCWWKTIGAGVTMMILDDNPWLWALLLVPAGFYAVQKLGLLRIP